MDPNFEKRLRDLQLHAAQEYAARGEGGQVQWFRPGGWDGDLTDLEGMGEPFSRAQSNQGCVDAIKDPKQPGTTGDVVAATTMIDYLATMERAFRVRHTFRRCRATALMLGRVRGHGSDNGSFIQTGVEYVRAIIRQAKEPPP